MCRDIYNMVKLRPGFSHWAFSCLNIFFSISVIESLMMAVASTVPNFLMGLITGAGVIGIIMMTYGSFVYFPIFQKNMALTNFFHELWLLGYSGCIQERFPWSEFEPMFAGEPEMTGEEVIRKIFGVKVTHLKWWNLAAIVLILVFYRILFFIVLKLKERAEPALKALQAKRTMKSLNKRPSFRKVSSLSSLSSRRHQPPRSLSSQEGLTSLIN